MEYLFAYSYLWAWGFCSMEEYNVQLDKLFCESPANEALLDLEECSSEIKDTFARLQRYFTYETNAFNSEKFGKTLFDGLEAVYSSGVYSIADFGQRCYKLWKMLPEHLIQEEPFFVLCYADDPLSWGDEKQTCKLYEEAFDFYNK